MTYGLEWGTVQALSRELVLCSFSELQSNWTAHLMHGFSKTIKQIRHFLTNSLCPYWRSPRPIVFAIIKLALANVWRYVIFNQ